MLPSPHLITDITVHQQQNQARNKARLTGQDKQCPPARGADDALQAEKQQGQGCRCAGGSAPPNRHLTSPHSTAPTRHRDTALCVALKSSRCLSDLLSEVGTEGKPQKLQARRFREQRPVYSREPALHATSCLRGW